MSRLADVLELIEASDQRWKSISATGIQANDSEPMSKLIRQSLPTSTSQPSEEGGRSRGFSFVFGPSRPRKVKPVKIGLDRWRIWLHGGDWSREEMIRGRHQWAALTKGTTWWAWQDTGPVTSNFGEPGIHSGQPITRALALLRPASLLPHVELTYEGKVTCLGRDAFALKGRLILGSHLIVLRNLGLVGDRCRLVIDAERGVGLGLECRSGTSRLLRTKVRRIEFDHHVDPSVFEPPSPPLDPADVSASHFSSLSSLPARLGRPVFVPVGVEFDAAQHPMMFRPHASLSEGDREVDRRPSVLITYAVSPGGRRGSLWINQSAEPFVRDEDKAWDAIDGIRARIGGARAQVRLFNSGVFIHMESDVYTRDELLSIAKSLEAIPTEPPRLVPNH